jgi:hypothetical protein
VKLVEYNFDRNCWAGAPSLLSGMVIASDLMVHFTHAHPSSWCIVMALGRNGKVAEFDRQVQIALARLRNGTYNMSIDQAVAAQGVPKTRWHCPMKGEKSRSEAQEWRQALTKHRERISMDQHVNSKWQSTLQTQTKEWRPESESDVLTAGVFSNGNSASAQARYLPLDVDAQQLIIAVVI